MEEMKNNLDKNQKKALIGLAVFSVLIIIFWGFNLNNHIKEPFVFKGTKIAVDSSVPTTDIEKLKTQDTDGDGLSDYDELNVYGTSPYLADTDSDGIPDGVEVKNGTDPNCPEGKNCTAVAVETKSSATSTSAELLDTAGTTNNASSSDMIGVDATTLRQMLIDSGTSKADLDKLSDDQILQSYLEAVQSASTTSATTTTQ